MIVLLTGKDRFRLVRRRTELRLGFLSKYPDGTVTVIDAFEKPGSVAAAIAEAGTSGLFSTKTLLDVREALSLPTDEAKKVRETLKGLGDDVSVVFSQTVAPKAKDEPYAFLRKQAGKTESFDELPPREAEAFARKEAMAVSPSVSFSRDALSFLIAACGTDSARLSSEAAKVALFKGEGEVSRADVETFVREQPQEKVFAALDALVAGNRGRALELLLREARADSGGVQKLFGLLAWQIRELFRVRGEFDRGNTRADDIARATGMKPYTAGKLVARMGAFPLPRLKRALRLLADLDADMKSGKIDPELALTLFVEKL
ncbi:MAG: DNA polymerase III subunit delta [Candidatus Moranbacteria bacterium]|nr:DNA polymerase III subunit delta [Candidatus Moranbacteria bacterium]